MSRIFKRACALVTCCTLFAFFVSTLSAQSVRQTKADFDALPQSNASTGFDSSRSGSRVDMMYRQASAQPDVYDYPASRNPGYRAASTSNYALPRSVASSQAPNYNLNPGSYSGQLRLAQNSRSPVEQQRSSTLSQQDTAARQSVQRQSLDPRSLQNTSTSAAQQAQAQAYQLAQQAQAQQAQAQQTYAQAQQAQARAGQLAQASQSAFRQTAYQSPLARTAQNCCPPGANLPGYNYSPTTNYNPTTTAYQTPALNPAVGGGIGVPPLNIQMPGQSGVAPQGQAYCQPNYQLPPGIGTPQFGAQGARWWTPFVTGSGVYPPLLKLQNMPVGTHLGQGIIGQPTAYVDGQPVRNLLRYIAP